MIYAPDSGAIPVGIAFTRQLSQRDLSLQIPINYVTAPGVALTPACFGRGRYEDVAAVKCFSNLLAVGFDRFIVDVYWDVTRHIWSLCPVELGVPLVLPSSSSSPPSTSSASPTGTAGRFLVLPLLDFNRLKKRQASSSLAPSQTSVSLDELASVSTTTTLNAGAGSPTSTPSAGELIVIEPYSCTTSVNLPLLTKVLNAHLDSTQYKQNATVKYLIMNLHAATSAADPTENANTPRSADLPTGNSLLSSLISSELSEFLYTPNDLRSERRDLNASSSWTGGGSTIDTNDLYFDVEGNGDHATTPNGWPSGSFIEMEFAKRMLTGFGQVDQQMQEYNFTGDSSTIFPQGYLQSKVSLTTNSDGQVQNGCFYDPSTYSIGRTNNSWATYATSINSDSKPSNITYCGISPILNETLDVTADKNYTPYMDYVQKTIWSWGAGEPQNSTTESRTENRCAALNVTSGYWQSENCDVSHRCACRGASDVYRWSISDSATTYTEAQIPCSDGTQFAVPHTALENTYLLHQWRDFVTSNNLDDELLWLNFNDLDAKACWVIGQNETCPYLPDRSSDRQVVVPTVAAIIVFVLAGLTVFVKCAANRQQAKSGRRRGDDGWDYEGVPS